MKKNLRKKILFLIYDLEKLSIAGIDVESPMKEAFEMLQELLDEKTCVAIEAMWENRCSATDKDNLTLGLMRFDREVRLLLIDKKLI